MAIAFDNADRTSSATGTSVTKAFTVGASASRILFAWVPISVAGNCTGVTYGGVSMTKYAEYTANSPDKYALFYLYNPASGSNNLIASFSVSQNTGGIDILSYSGVKQSGFPDYDSGVQANASATSITCTLVPVAANCWGIMFGDLNRSYSTGTNYTNRIGAGNDVAGDSNGTISGSTNMTITQALSSSIYAVAFSIAPGGNAYSQPLTESITASDSVLRTVSRTFTESVTNTASAIKTASRTFIEAISLGDTIVRTASRTFIEAITNTDAFSGLRTKPLNATEAITVAAQLVRTITRTFVEAFTNTDTLAKTASRAFAEAITIASTLQKTAGRTLAEVITLTSSMTRTITRSLIEAIIVTATLVRTTSRAFIEGITNSDSFVSLHTALFATTEAVTLTDNSIRTLARTLSEATTATASLIGSRLRMALLTDSITATDVFARVIGFALSLMERSTLSDTLIKLRNGFDVFWRNVSKSATGTISNMAKSVTTWRNKPRS